MEIRPFRIAVPDADIAGPRARLARTRWPDEINDADWSYGARADWLKTAFNYWADGFDWRAQEAAINSLPQFKATIDGLDIHYIHVRGRGPSPQPLLITHGWPGCLSRCSTSSRASPIRRRSAATPPTRSTSSYRRCPATASPIARPHRA